MVRIYLFLWFYIIYFHMNTYFNFRTNRIVLDARYFLGGMPFFLDKIGIEYPYKRLRARPLFSLCGRLVGCSASSSGLFGCL